MQDQRFCRQDPLLRDCVHDSRRGASVPTGCCLSQSRAPGHDAAVARGIRGLGRYANHCQLLRHHWSSVRELHWRCIDHPQVPRLATTHLANWGAMFGRHALCTLGRNRLRGVAPQDGFDRTLHRRQLVEAAISLHTGYSTSPVDGLPRPGEAFAAAVYHIVLAGASFLRLWADSRPRLILLTRPSPPSGAVHQRRPTEYAIETSPASAGGGIILGSAMRKQGVQGSVDDGPPDPPFHAHAAVARWG